MRLLLLLILSACGKEVYHETKASPAPAQPGTTEINVFVSSPNETNTVKPVNTPAPCVVCQPVPTKQPTPKPTQTPKPVPTVKPTPVCTPTPKPTEKPHACGQSPKESCKPCQSGKSNCHQKP